MKLLEKLGKSLEFHVLRTFDVIFLIVFDLIVYTAAVASLWLAIFIAAQFFTEPSRTVEVAKVVSSVCAMVGYFAYTITDLTLYLIKVWKGSF